MPSSILLLGFGRRGGDGGERCDFGLRMTAQLRKRFCGYRVEVELNGFVERQGALSFLQGRIGIAGGK